MPTPLFGNRTPCSERSTLPSSLGSAAQPWLLGCVLSCGCWSSAVWLQHPSAIPHGLLHVWAPSATSPVLPPCRAAAIAMCARSLLTRCVQALSTISPCCYGMEGQPAVQLSQQWGPLQQCASKGPCLGIADGR